MYVAPSQVSFSGPSSLLLPSLPTIIINCKRSTMQLTETVKYADWKWTKIKTHILLYFSMTLMTRCPQGNFWVILKILCEGMPSKGNKTKMLIKIMPFELLPQLPISKFIGRLLSSLKLGVEKQTLIQSKPLLKMELSESHIITSVGGTDFSRFKFIGHATGVVFAKNNHLAGNRLINWIADRDGCAFHHVESHNSSQGFRLGHICRRLMHRIHPSVPILPHLAQIKNLNRRLIPQNHGQILEIKLSALHLHSCIHWPYVLVRALDCLWVFGLFVFW